MEHLTKHTPTPDLRACNKCRGMLPQTMFSPTGLMRPAVTAHKCITYLHVFLKKKAHATPRTGPFESRGLKIRGIQTSQK